MLSRPLRRTALFVCGCASWMQAAALGFDAAPGSIALGAALDLTIPLRVGRGEIVDARCVRAGVRIGDRPIDASDLAVAVEPAPGGAGIRLRSRTPVDEPLVTVELAVDCGAPLARRFVVLADPPPAAVGGGLAASAGRAAATMASASFGAPGSMPRGEAPAAQKPERRASGGPADRGMPPGAAATAPAGPSDARHVAPPRPGATAAHAPGTGAATGPDVASGSTTADAGVGTMAAPQARAQVQALQDEVEALRRRNAVQQQTIDRLQRSLASADGAPIEARAWLPVGALALLSTWLGVRLHAARRERRMGGQRSEARGRFGLRREAFAAAAAGLARRRFGPAADPRAGAASPGLGEQAVQAAEPAVAVAVGVAAPAVAPYGVDELIDLDQQVDFFMVLGEEQAAAALLESQLDAPLGASPLAWLRLLALLHRRADREGYRRLGERLTQRFGVEPPPWERGPESGRGLAGCSPLIDELQVAWPKSAAAMRVLEAVLRRRARAPWLDLPALRDALLLYAVARDLCRRDETETPQVDLWLPLHAAADGGGADGPDAATARRAGGAGDRPAVVPRTARGSSPG